MIVGSRSEPSFRRLPELTQGRSRGKRSRHSGTTGHHETPATTGRTYRDIAYPKYDAYAAEAYRYKDAGGGQSAVQQCAYATKYGEDCRYAGKDPGYNKTWPKQQAYVDEAAVAAAYATQDDRSIAYLQEQLEENARLIQQQQQEQAAAAKYAAVNKKKQQQQQQQYYYERRADRASPPPGHAYSQVGSFLNRETMWKR